MRLAFCTGVRTTGCLIVVRRRLLTTRGMRELAGGPHPWFTLLMLVSMYASAQTYTQSGVILTRSQCFPGNSVPSNFVQGPSPVLRTNGDIDILVNSGSLGRPSCGVSQIATWEGIFSLTYPASGPPLWHPIWGTENWGTEPLRNEDQAPFPSAIFFANGWHIAYTSTNGTSRVGRIDPPSDLTSPAQPQNVVSEWVTAINPGVSGGTGLFP